MKKRPEKPDLEIIRRGLSWWLVRLIPFLLLYLLVKTTFFMGYFEIFGSGDAQLVAHGFFVKALITICAGITVVALHKYFITFLKSVLYSFGKSIFYKEKNARHVSSAFSQIFMFLIYLTVLVIILNIWMSNAFGWMLDLMKSSTITIFSFILGLFASSVLGNVASYYVINRVKEIMPGDRIKVGDDYGDVTGVDFFFTHVKNLDNEIVSIPNIILVTKGIKNYSKYPEVVVHFELTLPHGVDVPRAKRIIIDAAKKTNNIIQEKEPTVWFKEVSSWAISCEVRVYTTKIKDLVQVKSDLVENVLVDLKNNRIPTGRDINLYGETHENNSENFPQ